MNYNTYQTLTTEQKEEYNWRFKEDVSYNFKGAFTLVMLFSAIVTNYIFLFYLIIKDPLFEKYMEIVPTIMYISLIVACVGGWLLIGGIVEYLFRVFYRAYQYSKWKKKNNIQYIHNYWGRRK